MKPLELILNRKEHLIRSANEHGSTGENIILTNMDNWIPRPKGKDLKLLLSILEEMNVSIKSTSFDALALPNNKTINFNNPKSIRNIISEIVFIEIKTSNQERVKENFSGFFFAITENEINSSIKLGNQYRIALYNKITGELYITTVSELLSRAKSTTWQLSLQI